jgi:hypothetical protein
MTKKILLIISVLEALVIGYLLFDRQRTPVNPPDVPVIEIVRDSIIRDSIFIEIEKIEREIVYIKEEFKQDSTNIMSANDSVLFGSFSRYIEDYNNK